MMYADSITKSFLNAGAQKAGTTTLPQLDDNQDPTYIGFQIKLDYSLNVEGDLDDLPHGLFTSDPKTDPYSCYNYLMSRGETKRAEYILEFETKFKKIVDNYPWYFVKVSGLADSWKIDTKNNFRGKEKKLVIETLESIDLRMTMIMDLYRKAVFDAVYMRWAVPDHMRYFKMKVIVSEIRPMKLTAQGYANSGPGKGSINIDGTNIKLGGSVSGTFPNLDFSNLELNTETQEKGLGDPSAPWSAGTFIEFSYSECELDVFNEAPAFLESVGNKPEAEATNKITILTHVIKEKNVYGLLGAIIEDTPNWWDYTVSEIDGGNDGGIKFPAAAGKTAVTKETQNKAAGPSITQYVNGYNDRRREQDSLQANPKAVEINDGRGIKVSSKDFVKDLWDDFREPTEAYTEATTDANDINLPSGTYNEVYWDEKHKPEESKSAEISQSAKPGNKSTKEAAKDFDKDHKGGLRNTSSGRSGLAVGIASAVSNVARNAVNRALLGNVYGVSPLTLIGSAQSILNNPVAAIEAILKKHSSPTIGRDLARKVQLTGQEIQLVKSIIGASSTGAEDSVKVNPDLVNNQGKTNLNSANINSNAPGKTNLTSANINSNAPGKANLRAPRKAVAKKANSNLTAFANAGSDPGEVQLEGPLSPEVKVQKEKLIGPNIIPAKLGKANLTSAPVEKVKLGKTNFK